MFYVGAIAHCNRLRVVAMLGVELDDGCQGAAVGKLVVVDGVEECAGGPFIFGVGQQVNEGEVVGGYQELVERLIATFQSVIHPIGGGGSAPCEGGGGGSGTQIGEVGGYGAVGVVEADGFTRGGNVGNGESVVAGVVAEEGVGDGGGGEFGAAPIRISG